MVLGGLGDGVPKRWVQGEGHFLLVVLSPTSTLSGDIILHVNQLRVEKFRVGTTDFYREEDWRVECDNA